MPDNRSGGEYILQMFAQTKDNILLLPPHMSDPGPFTLRWDLDDAMRTAIECDRLLAQIRRIGEVLDDLKPTRQENEGLLPEDLLEIWDIYVRPLEVGSMSASRASGIQVKKDMNKPITMDEWAYLQRFRHAELLSALKRLPHGGIVPSELIRRGHRYARLVSLDAPAIILGNEAKLFARAYALYLWAED